MSKTILLHDALEVNPRRRCGAQAGALVECRVHPKTHGFYPSHEQCPLCDYVPKAKTSQASQVEDMQPEGHADHDDYYGYPWGGYP